MNTVRHRLSAQTDVSVTTPTLIQARARAREAFSRYHSAVLKGKASAHLLLEDYRRAQAELRALERQVLEETARATAALFGRKGRELR